MLHLGNNHSTIKTMARHRHKKARVNVYFKYKGHLFKLLEAINFGSRSLPEIKIKGLTETYIQIRDDKKRFDGMLHEGQLIRFVDGKHLEFTYHKDGAILVKVIHPSGDKEQNNPYGTGERWTPITEIKTFQPIMMLLISSIASYLPTVMEEKCGLINYVVKNEQIFEFTKGQSALVLIYLRNKNYPLAKYCFAGIYSDVLISLNDNLDLCIMIQKQLGQEWAGSWKMNRFMFLSKLDGFDYFYRELKDHIFDHDLAGFLSVIQEGNCYFDISEEMMQVIESADPLYNDFKTMGAPVQIHKPTLIRCLLDSLDGNYSDYLKLSKEKQKQYLIGLYKGVIVGSMINELFQLHKSMQN